MFRFSSKHERYLSSRIYGVCMYLESTRNSVRNLSDAVRTIQTQTPLCLHYESIGKAMSLNKLLEIRDRNLVILKTVISICIISLMIIIEKVCSAIIGIEKNEVDKYL